MFSDKRFGLSSSLIAATRGVLAEAEDKENKDKSDPKMMKGGKTKVDLEPKTDDDIREADVDKKKPVKEGKEHTVPKTDKEKKLASLAHPKDKITHKDVLVGRGVIAKEEAEIEEATKSATYNALMADPMKNRLERLKQKEKSMPSGISADRKKLAIDKDKIQKQLAKKQRNEEVEEMEEASMFSSKVKQGKGAAADTGSARYDFGKNAAPRRPDDTGKNVLSRRVFVKGAKPKGKLPEEVELDEAHGVIVKASGNKHIARVIGRLKSYGSVEDKVFHDKKEAINHLRKFGIDNISHKGYEKIDEEVELSAEELERIEAIAQSLDEDKPTIVSAPIRGANQDQSGENTKSTSSAYTISDSKKMKKEEVELDEAKRGRPKKNPTPDDEQDEHEHVIMQLRKVVSTHGALPVKHLDGKSTKITPQLAQHALNKHSAMKTAAEKQDFETKMHKSHDSMKSALGQQ